MVLETIKLLLHHSSGSCWKDICVRNRDLKSDYDYSLLKYPRVSFKHHKHFSFKMPSLLSLPRELRDHIWAHACQRERTWSSYGFTDSTKMLPSDANAFQSVSSHAILQTCRQICYEVTPFFYETVCVSVVHPNQVIRWLRSIGARNSSCIRHLVIRFTSLRLKYNEERYVKDRTSAWDAALRSLPKLLSLTFDFEQNSNISMIWATFDDSLLEKEMLVSDTVVGDEIAASAAAWTKLLQPSLSRKAEAWEYQPNLNERPVTHAFIAVDEAIPPLLLHYFQTLLQLTSNSSFERSVTGLPTKFFADAGFYLARTYAFNEDPENPSFSLSYGKQRRTLGSPLITLHAMLKQLPDLLYLRVGCRNVDSSFLAHLPLHLQTLDVAFTDTEPEQVAANLQSMRARCEKLFTVAIAVSPLHDRDLLDDKDEKIFNRKTVSKDVLQLWEPFWKALEHLKNTGVRVWEGEGPGFKREKIRDSAA